MVEKADPGDLLTWKQFKVYPDSQDHSKTFPVAGSGIPEHVREEIDNRSEKVDFLNEPLFRNSMNLPQFEELKFLLRLING